MKIGLSLKELEGIEKLKEEEQRTNRIQYQSMINPPSPKVK
jgi:hypothetical protein